jgi:hypothetical protein
MQMFRRLGETQMFRYCSENRQPRAFNGGRRRWPIFQNVFEAMQSPGSPRWAELLGKLGQTERSLFYITYSI